MNVRLRLAVSAGVILCFVALTGCSATPDDQTEQPVTPAPGVEIAQPSPSPEGQEPESLFDEISAADYTQWTPAPGYESRVAAKGPHGDEVQILLHPTAEETLARGGDRWPLGTVIAKDIFRNGELVQIAAMKMTADGWHWGEWDPHGNTIVEGLAVEPCEGCHADSANGTLGVDLR